MLDNKISLRRASLPTLDCVYVVYKIQFLTYLFREVVVAHLVEWLLLTPEVRGSNPVISINLY